jgi:hypothetical protein
MLVVIDNAASIEQVRPLLPGIPECAVLITSRNRFGGLAVRHGARILDVDRLSTDQAEKLLFATIGARAAADPDHVTRLAARCAGPTEQHVTTKHTPEKGPSVVDVPSPIGRGVTLQPTWSAPSVLSRESHADSLLDHKTFSLFRTCL